MCYIIQNQRLRPLRPLMALEVWYVDLPSSFLIFNKEKLKNISGKHFSLGAISHWRTVVTSLKIVINLPRTYKRLYCKGEPYQLARSFVTDKKLTTLYNRITEQTDTIHSVQKENIFQYIICIINIIYLQVPKNMQHRSDF